MGKRYIDCSARELAVYQKKNYYSPSLTVREGCWQQRQLVQ